MSKETQRPPVFLLIAGGIIAVAATIGASIVFASSQKPTQLGHCTTQGAAHQVIIENGKMTPLNTTAKRCDTLRIANRDNIVREIGFGNHDKHVPYDGVSQKVLHQDQSLTITLVDVGHFHFHDHFHDEIEGEFEVSR